VSLTRDTRFLNMRSCKLILKTVASVVAIGIAGEAALGQTITNNPPAAPSGSSTNVTQLEDVTVTGKLNTARNQIVPDLGATVYSVTPAQIGAEAQGANAPFNQALLRTPGMAEDSLGQLHLRGEHANIQYRINDVLLPEGVTGFGQELDTRFMQNMRLITGSLPAQYGFRTAGIVDIQTKTGVIEPGGEVSVYGGSYDTIKPSVEYGGSGSNVTYYVMSSYNQNGIGIENPTAGEMPIHDKTDQSKTFAYLSYVLDDTSRISVIASASYGSFQLPDTAGLPAGLTPDGSQQWVPGTFNSAALDENQIEKNYYGVVAYQKTAGDLNFQVAAYGRSSEVHFIPDVAGDLFYNGVASDVERTVDSAGLQTDASYQLNEQHTLRGGFMLLNETLTSATTTTVFPVDGAGNPTGPAFPISDNGVQHAFFGGVYLQDEWKITPQFTVNYGARFDVYCSTFDNENQISPRVNFIYQATDTTTLHAGYARYFTPPPLENVPAGSVTQFDGTSNAAGTDQASPVKAESAHYFDAGITQKILPGWQVGLDGYYKIAKNQLDDGFFGASLIPSAFNYSEGRVYGTELTSTYTKGGFSVFANVAWSVAQGLEWSSAQFLFDPAQQAYTKNNWIALDHDQRFTGSFGASYLWKEDFGSTLVYFDVLYGSGLRTDGVDAAGNTIPNGAALPPYYSPSVGVEQRFNLPAKHVLKLRLDVVNVTDNIYELRDGSGVGVNAAQYGMRRGFFGTVGLTF
jgi:outer membrane receptor protein involved in Fe transport